MMRTILIIVTLALLVPAVSAADVTEVPAGISTEAIELYRIAIQLRPTFPQAHDYLARAYLAKGDKAAALREYENPDYNDMPWNASRSGVASSSAA